MIASPSKLGWILPHSIIIKYQIILPIIKEILVEAGGIEKTPSQDSILRINNNFLPSLGHFTEIIYHKNVSWYIRRILSEFPPYCFIVYVNSL